ncbi:hypothetical protein TraAM80_03906 [Trypanosoma rangeli]|uniref:B30.2/SPRY domain-containing protein n=1 Tax=Trypanosoma rangeli TaxID=5698 RepID=A0A3R7L2T5_TRYRA|nr:uncharacterized protein TraAM80_03906 [Trypanosoma rangeli]RNF06452.1 hypothetical protein TraAM80_03906 [Trypanosoma rangeli]|eukprot:RNF06452.1 hypothetical protein TraAM80_03906 [Trypanosoma rangeli]
MYYMGRMCCIKVGVKVLTGLWLVISRCPPGSGKLYYEIRTNTDACKLGLCTKEAFRTLEDLEEVELGKRWDPFTHGGAPSCGECWVFNCQTSMVEVNGEKCKRLWRLFVPVSGARFGFLVDTDEGCAQLFVNDEYQGIVFETSLGLRGKTLHPCVGLEGMDVHNKIIGAGNKGAFVSPLKATPAFLTTF